MSAEQKPKLTPYQRIWRAAKKGVGVRLSPDETWALAHDDAIRQVAEGDEEASGDDAE